VLNILFMESKGYYHIILELCKFNTDLQKKVINKFKIFIIIWLILSLLILFNLSILGVQPIYSEDNKTLESTDEDDPTNNTAIISTIIGAAAGLGGLFWGLYTYRKEPLLKRKDVLFPLIKELDESKEIMYAKKILDDINIKPEQCWIYPNDYYNKENLERILRYHEPKGIIDPGEYAIRMSFDALLDFFCKLEYLRKIKLIKPEEIDYFKYYINKAAAEPSVIRYVSKYNFPLYGILDKDLRIVSDYRNT
jgi:hypothetical protein